MPKELKIKTADPKLTKKDKEEIEKHLNAARKVLHKVSVREVVLTDDDEIFKITS